MQKIAVICLGCAAWLVAIIFLGIFIAGAVGFVLIALACVALFVFASIGVYMVLGVLGFIGGTR